MMADLHMELDRKQRLDEVARIAVRLEADTGLPAEALVAQWALESKWGQRPAGKANYFGIKKAARHEQCCVVTTHEVVDGRPVTCDLEFADYRSLEDSCWDYAWLITQGEPYRNVWAQYGRDNDVRSLVSGIARVYATSPEYGQLAARIAGQENVARAVREARMKVTA